jgi:hypothetical protein
MSATRFLIIFMFVLILYPIWIFVTKWCIVSCPPLDISVAAVSHHDRCLKCSITVMNDSLAECRVKQGTGGCKVPRPRSRLSVCDITSLYVEYRHGQIQTHSSEEIISSIASLADGSLVITSSLSYAPYSKINSFVTLNRSLSTRRTKIIQTKSSGKN